MSAIEIVRAAIPNASEGLVDFILFDRTPFPCGPVTPQELYQAANRWERARLHGRQLCTFCDREVPAGEFDCATCAAALDPDRKLDDEVPW